MRLEPSDPLAYLRYSSVPRVLNSFVYIAMAWDDGSDKIPYLDKYSLRDSCVNAWIIYCR